LKIDSSSESFGARYFRLAAKPKTVKAKPTIAAMPPLNGITGLEHLFSESPGKDFALFGPANRSIAADRDSQTRRPLHRRPTGKRLTPMFQFSSLFF